jgi:NADPH-dependent curcumin reductase CurA
LPSGPTTPDVVSVQAKEVPDLDAGQLLLRPLAFSVDATLRGQLTGVEGSYFLPQIGLREAITGIALAEVVASRRPDHPPGDRVIAQVEWAELSVWPTHDHLLDLTTVDPRIRKPSHALSVYGSSAG